MKQKQDINYIGVGIFVFVGIILVILAIFFAGQYNYRLTGGIKIFVKYDYLDNIHEGSKVRVLGGMTVGYVDQIIYRDKKLTAVIVINGKYKINRSATFHIYSTSLVGQKYIDVMNYDPEEGNYYTNNEVIHGITPMGISRTLELAGNFISVFSGNTDDEIMSKISTAIDNVLNLMSTIDIMLKDNRIAINQSVKSLSYALEETREIMRSLNNIITNLEMVSADLHTKVSAVDNKKIVRIVDNIDTVTLDVKTKIALFEENKIINILSNLSKSAKTVESISSELDKIMKDPNGAVALTKEKEVKNRVNTILKNLEETSEDAKVLMKNVKEKPSILLK